MKQGLLPVVVLLLTACVADAGDPEGLGHSQSLLTSAERRVRAGEIRDAAARNGITQGYLLAGVADAETQMSHCWSELTWACKGPASPDCGGGPVVAGAGDGPCHLREGGIGMFQFDAGTFDDTLRREGDRILTIEGNVAAAVDFVVGMVIRSVYVEGVDTRAEAIAWMNGVRIDNARLDAWHKTVTRYYNGCQPGWSCWSQRLEHYTTNTTGVYWEMGADFWKAGTDYAASFVEQSFPLARDPFELRPGEEHPGYIELRNEGTESWVPDKTFLGTTEPRDGESPLVGPDWVSPSRPATVGAPVEPGGVGRFEFTVRAPAAPGDYPQFFSLVQEGVAWFSDRGGPPDDQLQIRLTVSGAPACPPGHGPAWTCDGSDRVRCEAGMTERAPCEHGCTADEAGEAVCADSSAPVDGDGDGHDMAVDCNDADDAVHPEAVEACGDGIDQDCDGEDLTCAAGPGGAMPPAAMPSSGGCAASGGRSAPLLPLALLLFFVRRRRGSIRR